MGYNKNWHLSANLPTRNKFAAESEYYSHDEIRLPPDILCWYSTKLSSFSVEHSFLHMLEHRATLYYHLR